MRSRLSAVTRWSASTCRSPSGRLYWLSTVVPTPTIPRSLIPDLGTEGIVTNYGFRSLVHTEPCIHLEEVHDEACLSLIHISEPTRLGMISYAVFCLKK